MSALRVSLAILMMLSLFCGFAALPLTVQAQDVGVEINTVEVDDQTFQALNPLLIGGDAQRDLLVNADGSLSPGKAISRAVNTFGFPIAGMILFVMFLWGGFEMLSGAASKKSIDDGKQRIMAALFGFLLLFVSYWIVEIAGRLLGVEIFG